MTTCKLCGYAFSDENIEESIEKHLKEKHFLTYKDYYEILMTGDTNSGCWNCGEIRYMISPWITNSFLPCPSCINFENKHKLKEAQDNIISIILDFQRYLLRSRHYQYIISLTPEERGKFLPKSFDIISNTLHELKRTKRVKLERTNQIYEITNTLGTSSEISSRNIKNLDMQVIDFKVQKMDSDDLLYKLGDLDLYIRMPEVVVYDNKHHSRNSILNPAAKRTSKRLKFGDTNDCIKFYSPSNPTVRSILCLKDGQGKKVLFRDLPKETQWKIKFGILKTKEILGRIFDIYNEIVKYISWIEDSVFLLNTLDFPFPNFELGLMLKWSWEDYDYVDYGGKTIKLSIL